MKKYLSVVLALIICLSTLSILGGCKQYDGEITVLNWGANISNGEDGSLDVIAEFEKKYNIKVNYDQYDSNEQLYQKLKNSDSSIDVIIPSDYMIEKLIKEEKLRKIDFSNIPNYKNIGEAYKNTNFDPNNEYSVPYTWGVVAICYNKTMVKGEVTSLESLWDESLKGNILMFDNSRDAFAIAMQLCGIDPSNPTKDDVDKAYKKLIEQKPLLKNYVMDDVFFEMEGSQSAIAPYYAGDIATMMSKNSDLAYCLPEEGSNFFIDSMCIPTCSKNPELAEKFINFMLEPEIGAANAEYIGYATPNTEAKALLDESIRNSGLIYPDESTYLSKCYTFANPSPEVYQYMEDKFADLLSY